MPRPRAETRRRRELVAAAIAAIHARGAADVTVADIARRAGFSPALAHHYFGSKDAMLLGVMRHLLAEYGRDAAAALRGLRDGRARVAAVVGASFGPAQFRPETISAWIAFYALAQRDAAARRLLRVYFARLRANLTHALRPLAGPAAPEIAETTGALIDGLYLRQGLSAERPDPAAAAATVMACVEARLPR